jgi:hypothetical protein
MLSPKKLEANRANASHSTGPRTPAGKRSSSQNAVKHGLNSPHLLVREDEREAFDQFEHELRVELLPATPLENDICAKLVHASWNLRRLRQLEDALFLHCDDPFTDQDAASKMNSYARHTARFERVYRNALRDLRQLQTDRALTVQASRSAPVELTALTDIAKVLKQTHRELPKSAKPIPFADEPTLQDLEDALCGNEPLHDLLTRAHPDRPCAKPNDNRPEPHPPDDTSAPYSSLVPIK